MSSKNDLTRGSCAFQVWRVKTKLVAVSTLVSFGCIAGIGMMGACSSSSSSSTASDASTLQDVVVPSDDAAVVNDPDNCVPPGTAGNSLGIGGYCSPLGGQCDTAGPGGAARICTADLTSTPAHAWFCTYPCSQQSDCGNGEVCFQNAQGAGCIPNTPACLSLDVDAGYIIEDDAGSPTTDAGDGG